MSYTKKMTEGSELKHIILFTLPLFAGNVFQQLYNIVDSIIVGKYLGANKLAAVGTTGSLTYLFSTLCIGLSVGAGILISQRFGAGMHKEVRKLITNSAYVIIAFGAVITVISVAFAGLLMKMMNTPENLLEDATAYMRAGVLRHDMRGGIQLDKLRYEVAWGFPHAADIPGRCEPAQRRA